MNTAERRILAISGAIVIASTALVIWPPSGWDRGSAAGVTQAVSSLVAITAALLIATQDRRAAAQTAIDDRRTERHAFKRRLDYDEAARLMAVVEQDRRALEQDPTTPQRSVEGTALVLAMWSKRNWWGTAADFYVEALRDPNNRFAGNRVTAADFRRMQEEIIEAIDKLDYEERRPD